MEGIIKAKQNFPTAEKLHTDILEQKYGPIHAEVLRHDDVSESKVGEDRIREAKLSDKENICRTYALTFLTYDKNDKDLSAIDDKIRKGGLIGKTFREYGFIIKKNVIDVFLLDLPEWLKKDFDTNSNKAKARITEFYAKKENYSPVIYGNVLEVYSPDFKDPKDGINDIDIRQINPMTSTLQSVGIPSDEIWSRLDDADRDDEWDDLNDKYEKAQKMSTPIINELREKINKYIFKK